MADRRTAWAATALIGALVALSCPARAADDEAGADVKVEAAAELRRLIRARQQAERLLDSVEENLGVREIRASLKETLEKAIALVPDNYPVVMRGGMFMRHLGYYAEAARVLEQALPLGQRDYGEGSEDYGPYLSLNHEWLGEIYQFHLAEPDAAERHSLAALAFDIDSARRSKINGDLFCLYINWESKFDREKLREHFMLQLFPPADSRTAVHFPILLALDGQTERAREAAAVLEAGMDYDKTAYVVVAYPYAMIGDNDAALRCLERGLEGQWENLGHFPGPAIFIEYTAWLRNMYALKNLRGDERFEALFERFDAKAREALEENGNE